MWLLITIMLVAQELRNLFYKLHFFKQKFKRPNEHSVITGVSNQSAVHIIIYRQTLWHRSIPKGLKWKNCIIYVRGCTIWLIFSSEYFPYTIMKWCHHWHRKLFNIYVYQFHVKKNSHQAASQICSNKVKFDESRFSIKTFYRIGST